MVDFKSTLALALAGGTWAGAALAEPALYADERDRFTLLEQHLLNRQLSLQLASDDQAFRLGRHWRQVALALDASIGTQQTPGTEPQSRFHGYYMADSYLGLRPFEGLEANLNVLLFNPSASDGYRLASQVSSGLALHGYYQIEDVLGGDLRLDLLGTDLGHVTTGAGLMLEQTPLEGVRASASWRGITYDWMYGGRALWNNDDFIVSTLSFLDRLLELRFVEWQEAGDDEVFEELDAVREIEVERYLGASTDIVVAKQWHLAGEVATRLGDRLRSAFMWRADYLTRDLSWLDVHAGYQARWYENGFGPRDVIDNPSTTFNVPRREDQYVTNSFEYLGLSSQFEQWSHTLMLEAHVRPFRMLELFAEAELWWRWAVERGTQSRAVPALKTPLGFEAPGSDFSVYYRTGLSLYPWPSLPHRLNGFVTNKQVQSDGWSIVPQTRRYDPGTYVVCELQAFF